MTDSNDLETLMKQNAELMTALKETTDKLADATEKLAAATAPAKPAETLTEAAQWIKKSEPVANLAPSGSLTRQAQDMAASNHARLGEVFRRRAQGLPDEEPAPALPKVGLTAQAQALRARG